MGGFEQTDWQAERLADAWKSSPTFPDSQRVGRAAASPELSENNATLIMPIITAKYAPPSVVTCADARQ